MVSCPWRSCVQAWSSVRRVKCCGVTRRFTKARTEGSKRTRCTATFTYIVRGISEANNHELWTGRRGSSPCDVFQACAWPFLRSGTSALDARARASEIARIVLVVCDQIVRLLARAEQKASTVFRRNGLTARSAITRHLIGTRVGRVLIELLTSCAHDVSLALAGAESAVPPRLAGYIDGRQRWGAVRILATRLYECGLKRRGSSAPRLTQLTA
ncbi:unnamed protein product [Trichogramma brassicae]|uniref:Uncharacterized protein n=1 Tax=Trichogramma brassicae TaxID=86971 RepID=A0A6H5I3H0_9HYME|nr:unnamed protein product [Trichogramma brassicae]